MPNYELVYFDGHGRGETIRMVLTFANKPFKDTRLQLDGSHLKYKEDGKSEFGGVPCLKVDNEWFSQSRSILRYLGIQFNMYPKHPHNAWLCDSIIDFLEDQKTQNGALLDGFQDPKFIKLGS